MHILIMQIAQTNQLTIGILVFTKWKQKLHVIFYKNGTEAQKTLYKSHANKPTKLESASKTTLL